MLRELMVGRTAHSLQLREGKTAKTTAKCRKKNFHLALLYTVKGKKSFKADNLDIIKTCP